MAGNHWLKNDLVEPYLDDGAELFVRILGVFQWLPKRPPGSELSTHSGRVT